MGRVQLSRLIPAQPRELFYHITDLSQLPAWLSGDLSVELPDQIVALEKRSEVELIFRRLGFRQRTRFRVDAFLVGENFTYRQISGFFRSWSHSQILTPHDEKLTLLTDIVHYEMPFGIIGALVDDLLVHRDVENILNERLNRIEAHFAHRP